MEQDLQNKFINLFNVAKGHIVGEPTVIINTTHVHHKYKAVATSRVVEEVKNPSFVLYLEKEWVNEETMEVLKKNASYIFVIGCDADGVPILKQLMPEQKYIEKQWIL